MARPRLIMALAKVIIAAAWADGQMTNEEINSLKDLLFRMPEMSARDWAALDIYIDSPVSEAGRMRLVEELKTALSSPADKTLAISKLDEVVSADGVVSEEEFAAIDEIGSAIGEVDVSIFGTLGRLLRGPVQRRSEAVTEAHNRELYLEDFIKNRIFYNVRRRLALGESGLDLPETEVRKLSLAGGLMARVAYVDRDVGNSEFDAVVTALQENWDISQEAATLVAEVAIDEISKDLDYYRLTRQFFERTTEAERVGFLDVLFAVAGADGQLSYEETEEIRTISKMLKLTHRQFIDAKLKVPRQRRRT
ncbi:MAG TPA: TerB family tellurite resistance protein [Anaerolineales bacterium]|nr:TerB family tellurite resistance protein [Anaerolineales bacterium]